jgi:NAD-dependent dihydropyrimidine dehydrogenase PreA subunit
MKTDSEKCKQLAGVFVPHIDPNRCEGKDACVRVCPFGVFEVRALTPTERKDFSLVTRIKLWIHGNRQAFAVHADQCHACGLCIQACPEHAITLVRASNALTPAS